MAENTDKNSKEKQYLKKFALFVGAVVLAAAGAELITGA
jgi:hypothetical protein